MTNTMALLIRCLPDNNSLISLVKITSNINDDLKKVKVIPNALPLNEKSLNWCKSLHIPI